MLNITIICVGKMKEKYFVQAAEEYAKRLGRYVKLDMIEVPDEKAPEDLSPGQEADILKKECAGIVKHLREGSYVITLEIEGTMLDSPEFAKKIDRITQSGRSHITFIIGGSLGLDPEIKRKADFALSFSKMTFPHRLMRVILLEQIYRCFRILNHEPYHK